MVVINQSKILLTIINNICEAVSSIKIAPLWSNLLSHFVDKKNHILYNLDKKEGCMEEKEIVVEDNAEKEKNTDARKEKNVCDVKEIMKILPMFLALGAIFMGLFYQFLPLVVATSAGIKAAASFMFIGYALATAALVLEAFRVIKEKNYKFSLTLLIIIIAFGCVIF